MKTRVLFILFFLAIQSFAFAQKNKASFDINLKAEKNELLIAVANDFYGWGIIARLESTDGITGIDEVKEFVRN